MAGIGHGDALPLREFSMSEETKKSSAGVILLAWLLVSVPLGWGVYNTLLNSMKLFTAPTTSAPAPAATAPTK